MIDAVGIAKTYGNRTILQDVSFHVDRGEILTLIGPSGTGKTTLLRILDLLERPDAGTIRIRGDLIGTGEKERLQARRRMSMVFQKPVALSGTVRNNVAIGLSYRGIRGEEAEVRVMEALALVGLRDFVDRIASTLSGGELQRIALARAMVTRPEVLLLDEPTANLDPLSSEKIERLIRTIRDQFSTTIVMSTHDMLQGQRLADRIAVLMDRRIGQIGSADAIFYQPSDTAIARMVGVENILPGRVTGTVEGITRIRIDDTSAIIETHTPLPAGTAVLAMIRPEEVILTSGPIPDSSARNTIPATVTEMDPAGPLVRVRITGPYPLAVMLTRRSADDLTLHPGSQVYAHFKASGVHVLPAGDPV